MSKALCLEILEYIKDYYRGSILLLLTICAVVILLLMEKELRRALIYPLILIVLVIVNPLLYHFVFRRIIYWRLFWMVPNGLLIATAVTKLLERKKCRIIGVIVLALVCLLVVCKGNNVYKSGVLTGKQNDHKIPQNTKAVCEALFKYDPKPNCIMPIELAVEAREYSGEIMNLYGRNYYAEYITEIEGFDKRIADEMIAEQPDYEYVLFYAKEKGRQFVITREKSPIEAQLQERYGYWYRENVNGYHIYYCENVEEKQDMGWIMTQLAKPSEDDCPMSGYVLEDGQGHLVVIDGGYSASNQVLKAYLNKHDRVVDAWILTSYEPSSAGAFAKLMQEYQPEIKQLMIPQMEEETFLATANTSVQKTYQSCKKQMEQLTQIKEVKMGDTFTLEDLTFEVLTDAMIETEKGTKVNANAYYIQGPHKNVLYTSNAKADAVAQLSEEVKTRIQSANYVQTSVQGSLLLGQNLYETITPEKLLMDANEGGYIQEKKPKTLGALSSYYEPKDTLVWVLSRRLNRITF